MRFGCKTIGVVLTLVVSAWLPALAQAQDDLGVTMRMVTEDQALSDQVVQKIELPGEAAELALPESLGDDAGAARDLATDALEQGRELSDAIAEDAREERENLGLPEPGEDSALDGIGDGVDDSLDGIGDTVDDGTDGTILEPVGDTLGETTDNLGDTVENTTDSLN